MKFERKTYYGINFSWQGVDSTGAIGEFTSGGGPIPKNVFADYSDYLKAEEFFSNLLPITQAFLTVSFIGEMKKRNKTFKYFGTKESRGIYCYDEDDYTDDYLLITEPKIELKLSDLPEEIQEYVKQFTFENIVFKEQKKIKITDYFDCEY